MNYQRENYVNCQRERFRKLSELRYRSGGIIRGDRQ